LNPESIFIIQNNSKITFTVPLNPALLNSCNEKFLYFDGIMKDLDLGNLPAIRNFKNTGTEYEFDFDA